MEDAWWLFFKYFLKGPILPIYESTGTKVAISSNFDQGLILQLCESLRTSKLSLIILLPRLRLLTFFHSRACFCRFWFFFVHFSHIRTCTYTNTKTYILLAFLVSIWCIWSNLRSKKDVWISTHQNPPD